MRLETSLVGGFNINQVLMAIVAIVSAGILIWRHRKRRGIQEQPLAEEEVTKKDDTEAEEIQE